MKLKKFIISVSFIFAFMPLLLLGGGELRRNNPLFRKSLGTFSDEPDSLTLSSRLPAAAPLDSVNEQLETPKEKVHTEQTQRPGQLRNEKQREEEYELKKWPHFLRLKSQIAIQDSSTVKTQPPSLPQTDDFAFLGFFIFFLLGIPFMGIFWPLGIVFSLLGLTFSGISLHRISKYPERFKGKTLALIPFIFILGTLIALLLALAFLWLFFKLLDME